MQTIPAITLFSIVTNRSISLQRPGKPTLLLIINQTNYQVAINFNPEIRRIFPRSEDLTVCNVVNLKNVPRLAKGIVNNILKHAYHEAAAALPAGYPPKDYILLLPDWRGEVFSALRINPGERQPVLAAIDSSGTLIGLHKGVELLPAAERFARKMLALEQD
jgi:hypothetical protein